MKTVILCGGKGERMGALTAERPKALVEVGGKPILEHVMRLFARAGFRDFVLCAGHRGPDLGRHFVEQESGESWATTLVLYTGEETGSGGRVKRALPWIGQERFWLAWCDGVTDASLDAMLTYHRARNATLCTVLAVHPPARFGTMTVESSGTVERYAEKPPSAEWVSGGMFLCEPGIAGLIAGDESSWERDVLPRLADAGQLAAFRHEGFWACMDTAAERDALDRMARGGRAPWMEGRP